MSYVETEPLGPGNGTVDPHEALDVLDRLRAAGAEDVAAPDTTAKADMKGADGRLQCPDCASKFRQRSSLRRHQQQVHGAPKGAPFPKAGSGADRPPRPPAPAASKSAKNLAGDLEMLVATASIALSMLPGEKFQADAAILAAGAPNLAQAWANLAEKNPAVRRVLEALTTGSMYTEVIMATAMVMLPIMANHGLVPDVVVQGMAGVMVSAAAAGEDAN